MYSQFHYKTAFESGYYISSNSEAEEKSNFEASLDVLFGYQYKRSENTGSISIRFKPEMYDFKNKFYSIKSNVSGIYGYTNNQHKINAGAEASFFNFDFDGSKIKYYSNLFHFLYELNLAGGKFFKARTGFSYRQLEVLSKIAADVIFVESSIYNLISDGIGLAYGINFEHFSTGEKKNVSYLKPLMNDQGNKIGPSIHFDLYRNFILKGEYKLLYVSSEITRGLSLEHYLRFIFGLNVNINSTLLIYADAYFNRYKYTNIDYEKYSYYLSSNIESSIYLKYSCDIKNNVEVYVKSGYYSIENYERKGRTSFLNFLIGLEITH